MRTQPLEPRQTGAAHRQQRCLLRPLHTLGHPIAGVAGLEDRLQGLSFASKRRQLTADTADLTGTGTLPSN